MCSNAGKIGHVRLASDAAEALARIGGDRARRAHAEELAERLDASARECRRLMAAT